MSWLTQYILDPIKAELAKNPEVASTVSPVVTSAEQTLGAATTAIDPLLNDLVTGAEDLAATYVSKIGPVGAALTPAVDLAISLGASAVASAINAKFGKTVLTVA